MRKGLGTERFSETSRVPEAKRESPSNYVLHERMHDGKTIFSPRASRETCHTFQKRLKILCLQCKLGNKSRCLYFGSPNGSSSKLLSDIKSQNLYNTTATRVRIGNIIGHITWYSWRTLDGRKLTLQTNGGNKHFNSHKHHGATAFQGKAEVTVFERV